MGAVIVPNRKNTAHGNVHFAVGSGIKFFGIGEKSHDLGVYLQGLMDTVGKVVDGAEVGDSLIAVIDIIKLMIFL